VLVRLLHVDLYKRSGKLFLFPRRGRLAGAKPNDHILPPRRLAWMKSDILDDAVALVEDPEHRHSLRHWSDAAIVRCSRRHPPRSRRPDVLLLSALAARAQRESDQQRCSK
jgi:hypothetical protein